MDLNLTEEQRLLRNTLREFVDQEVRPVAREWEQAGRYPTDLVNGMKRMGLFGITVPDRYGGIEADFVSLALVFEELARGWLGLAGTLGTHSLACFMIASHGTQKQKEKYLPTLATGERRSGLALTEPNAGTDLQRIETRAWRDGDEYVVRGTKIWITNARYADPLPVLVKTDVEADPPHRGMSVLLVEQDTPGYRVSRDMPKLGNLGTESCELEFDDARVSVANLLGGVEGQGFKQVSRGLEVGRINVAARSVGVAQEAYDQALAYSRQRHAFGRPIADFQAVQLRLAEMATRAQAARLLTWWAASIADLGGRVDVQAGMAKYYSSEAAIENALDSMRIHGGAGYSKELEIERMYRDAPLMAIGEGTNDMMRLIIARGLLEGRVVLG